MQIIAIILFLWLAHLGAGVVHAVNCSSVPLSGNYTANETCTFANSPIDGIDAGTGGTNTAILTIGASGNLSILNGQTIAVGSIVSTAGGTITIVDGGVMKIGSALYVTDADGDLYPAGSSISLSGTTRRNTMTSATSDCYDSNANAHPGQGSYFTSSRGDGSYDYDCDSGASLQYTTTTTAVCYTQSNDPYSCSPCTTYAYIFTQPANDNSGGWQNARPGCGSSDTYWTPTAPYNAGYCYDGKNCGDVGSSSVRAQGCR